MTATSGKSRDTTRLAITLSDSVPPIFLQQECDIFMSPQRSAIWSQQACSSADIVYVGERHAVSGEAKSNAANTKLAN
ncbi:MAG: hypothetical protein NVS9B15_14090 [Acidobacteriaceae bacterium]